MNALKRVVVLGATVLVSTAGAIWTQATLHVDGNARPPGIGTPSAPFTYIQSAIASAANGDVVRVAPATYFENLDFLGKSIQVIGVSGSAATIVDGCRLGPVVRFRGGESSQAVLEGFTLRNGHGGSAPGTYFGSSLYRGGDGEGGGIHMVQATPVIRSCVIEANSGGDGEVAAPPAEIDASGGRGGAGGIECVAASPTVEDCTIVANVGGLPGNADLTVAGLGGDGGDGGIGGSGMGLVLRRTTVAANVGTPGATGSGDEGWGGGGGVDVDGVQSVVIERSIIEGNVAGFGGADAPAGGVTIHGPAACLVDCLIASNDGASNGVGGIVLQAGSLALVHATVVANTGAAVGGLEIRGPGSASIVNSILWGNQAALPGPSSEIGWSPAYVPPLVATSAVQGGFAGNGVIAVDPIFRNAATGDWRLRAESPCIDAADPVFAQIHGFDLEGNPRSVGGGPDMGAFESCFIGTLEDLILLSDAGGGDYENCLKDALAGASLSIYYASPGGGFAGEPALLAVDLLPLGLEPAPVLGLPAIHLSSFAFALQSGPLPPAGSLLTFLVPPTVAGFHARFQAFVAAAGAANGSFAASSAHDIAF